MDDDKKFAEWLKDVDAEVSAQIGLSYRDLADYMFRDAFDDGLNPAHVALDVIANDDTFSMFL